MEFDPLEEYRGTDKERNGARVSIEMMINSAKYTPQQHLCYVCQKFPISQECSICHKHICTQCIHICCRCQQICCSFCSKENDDTNPTTFICCRCFWIAVRKTETLFYPYKWQMFISLTSIFKWHRLFLSKKPCNIVINVFY